MVYPSFRYLLWGYSDASYGSCKAFLWGYRRYPQDPWRWLPWVLEAIRTTRRCHRYDPWERLPTPLEGFTMTEIQNLRGEGSKPHTRFSLRERTVVWRGYLERPSPRSPDKRTAGENDKRVRMWQEESERVRMFIVILSNCYIFANVKKEVPTPKSVLWHHVNPSSHQRNRFAKWIIRSPRFSTFFHVSSQINPIRLRGFGSLGCNSANASHVFLLRSQFVILNTLL